MIAVPRLALEHLDGPGCVEYSMDALRRGRLEALAGMRMCERQRKTENKREKANAEAKE